MDILSLSLVIVCVLVQYSNHLIDLNHDLLHLLIDFLHVCITVYMIVYPMRIVLTGKGSLYYYNLFMILFFLQGIIFEGCIINKIHEHIDPRYNWSSIGDRITFNFDKKCIKGADAWLKGNKPNLIYFILINFISKMK